MARPRWTKKALETLARAHYRDPWLYSRRYQRRTVDLAHYTRLAAAAGRCVELGAGTGRITLPLARAGADVVAIEREENLVAELRRRLVKETRAVRGRVHIVSQSFVDVMRRPAKALGGTTRERLIIAPFNALSHVHETAELSALLGDIAHRLAPGGVFAFDIPMPEVGAFLRDPARRYALGSATGPRGERYRYYESFEYDAARQLQLILAHYDVAGPGGGPEHPQSFVLPLLHRQYFPQELRWLLSEAGYEVRRHDGDFAGGALEVDSLSQVLVCTK